MIRIVLLRLLMVLYTKNNVSMFHILEDVEHPDIIFGAHKKTSHPVVMFIRQGALNARSQHPENLATDSPRSAHHSITASPLPLCESDVPMLQLCHAA